MKKYQKYLVAAKEAARVIVLAAVSAGITAVVGVLVAAVSNAHLGPVEAAIIIGALTSAGKAWDRAIHDDPSTTSTGIVPF